MTTKTSEHQVDVFAPCLLSSILKQCFKPVYPELAFSDHCLHAETLLQLPLHSFFWLLRVFFIYGALTRFINFKIQSHTCFHILKP